MIIIKNTHVQSCGFRNSLCEPVFEFIFSKTAITSMTSLYGGCSQPWGRQGAAGGGQGVKTPDRAENIDLFRLQIVMSFHNVAEIRRWLLWAQQLPGEASPTVFIHFNFIFLEKFNRNARFARQKEWDFRGGGGAFHNFPSSRRFFQSQVVTSIVRGMFSLRANSIKTT